MELIITSEASVINVDAIAKGDLIRAKYAAWEEERNGQVAGVTRDEIRVIWQPGIRNVTNFFSIYAEEVAAGLWSVKWSPDLETVHVWPPEEPEEPAEEPPAEEDETPDPSAEPVESPTEPTEGEEPEPGTEHDGGDDPPGGGSE